MDRWQPPEKFKSRFVIRKPISILQSLMVFYLAVWSISPPLSIDNIYRIIALGCAFGWFFLELLIGTPLKRIHILALIFMLLVILVGVIEYKGEWSKLLKLISFYMAVMAFIMAHSYSKRMNEIRWIVPICLVLFIYFNFVTYRELQITPGLARRLAKINEDLFVYQRRGVGGYALLYSQVLILPVVLAWVINAFKKKKWLFIAIGAVWLISYYLMMMSSGYTIALLASIAGVFILLFYKKKSVIPAFVITFLLIAGVVLIIGYVDPIREFLLDIFGTTKVSSKIRDIYDSVHGLGTSDSIEVRMRRYTESFTTIFDYVFIGGLWNSGGGGHSAILDTFAKYGLFGGTMFAYMIFNVPISFKKSTWDPAILSLTNAALVALLLVTILDSVPYNLIFPIMILTPLMINDIQQWRNTDENSLDSKSASGRSLPKVKNPV